MAVRGRQWYIDNSSNANEAVGKYVTDGGSDPIIQNSLARYTGTFGRSLSGGNQQQSSNKQMGSVTNPFDVMKNSRGDSKISNMSDTYKTGIESEVDFKDKINDAILKQLKLEGDLHTQINESMGLTGELSTAFRDSLIGTLPAAATLGYDISNISDAITSLSEKTGKWNIIASNTLERGFQTARAFGMTLPQLSDAFNDFNVFPNMSFFCYSA